jgi:hypothetical protein
MGQSGWQAHHQTKARQSRVGYKSHISDWSKILAQLQTMDWTPHGLISISTVRTNWLQGINNSSFPHHRLSQHFVWVVKPFHYMPLWNLRSCHLLISNWSWWCFDSCLSLVNIIINHQLIYSNMWEMWYSYLIFYSCHSHCRNAESQYAPLYIISLRNDEKQVPRSSGTTMTRWMFCTRITRRLVVLLLDWVL